LVKAVDSIIEPKIKVEIIVVTDKVDNHEPILEMLAGREVRVVRGPQRGAPGARNEGARLSNGRYVAHLDDDDVWLPEKATSQIQEIEKSGDPTRAFSVVGVKFASQNGKVRYTSDKGYRAGKESLANYIVQRKAPYYHGTHFCASSILISRQLLETIEFNEVDNIHEDWDFIIRLGKMSNVRVVQLHERLIQMNQGSPNSISAAREWQKSLAFLERFNDDIYGRARFDFILCNVMLPSIILKSFTGFMSAARKLPFAVPHYGAVVRFSGGLIFRR
jgi:glycosyltransferase involved in cell wall biosynthesis